MGVGGQDAGTTVKWLSLLGFLESSQNLFMLVAGLMGLERMQAAYAHAVERGYRFYSYGDGSLLLP